MGNARLLTAIIVLLLVGCGSTTKPDQPSSERGVRPGPTATAKASPATQPMSRAAAKPVSIDTLPAEEWSPKSDQQQHTLYHWPADFQLPVDIQMAPPEVPAEIAGPSPPIAQTN